MTVILSATALIVGAGVTSTAQGKGNSFLTSKCNKVAKGIKFWRDATWKWQEKYDHTYTRSAFYDKHTVSCKFGGWIAQLWMHRAREAKRKFQEWFKGMYDNWDCIHRHEAAWNGDNNPDYDGGLQMDYGFQTTYGLEFHRRWGNASNWPVWAQLLAAERAYHGYNGYGGRGFGPWPTRHYCGL